MSLQDTSRATVTVCVPVWNGEAFVVETLASLKAQTFTDFEALVSVDQSDDRSLAICRSIEAEDSRFSVFEQPGRLGWIGNVNWLLARIQTEFACILPHDDVMAATYRYLAAESVGLTARNLAAFLDDRLNGLLELDGEERAVVHLTMLGKEVRRPA